MVDATHERLIGATEWDQHLFDRLGQHEQDEKDAIQAYADFAEQTGSQTVKYLINMIVDDERKHHRVLAELANTIRAEVTFEERGSRLPYLDVHRGDRTLLDATRRFLEVERRDRAEMRGLAKEVDRTGNELDSFLIKMILDDTDRHIRILRFIERLAKHSPLP